MYICYLMGTTSRNIIMQPMNEDDSENIKITNISFISLNWGALGWGVAGSITVHTTLIKQF